MAFDTSNVAEQVQVPQPQTTPLQTVEGLAGAQNAMNQNRMFQAKALAGQYLAASTKPDGSVDMGKFVSSLQADPRTNAFGVEGLQGAQTLQGQGISNQTGATSLRQQQYQNLQRDLATYGVASSASDPTQRAAENQRAAARAVAQGVQAGRYPAEMASDYLGGAGPSSFADDVRAAAIAGAGGAGAQEALTGKPTTIGTGGSTHVVAVNPYLGSTSEIGELPNTMTPAEKAGLHDVVDPITGQHKLVPTSAYATATGEAKPNVAGLTDEHGALTGSLAPGAAEGRTAVGETSGRQYASDLAEANGSGQRVAILKKVDELLQTPEGKTGPGTQVVTGWRNFLLANAPAVAGAVSGGLDEAKIKSATQDELKKYMVQIAGNAASQFGPGTNEKLAVAASGNANPDLSNLANQDVTRMNIALERAKQARLATAQAQGVQPENYSTWASTWNRTVDPRAFMLDMLTKGERTKMLATVKTPAEKKAFLMGKKAAEASGLYQDSDIPR